ncbi:hypothetical protein EDD86DRAFT_201202 [Gorgonomyces haynaldii]|nr:hypothetical protein EDD86DRAFT_201202 [Gorgonomyces haynaldii]
MLSVLIPTVAAGTSWQEMLSSAVANPNAPSCSSCQPTDLTCIANCAPITVDIQVIFDPARFQDDNIVVGAVGCQYFGQETLAQNPSSMNPVPNGALLGQVNADGSLRLSAAGNQLASSALQQGFLTQNTISGPTGPSGPNDQEFPDEEFIDDEEFPEFDESEIDENQGLPSRMSAYEDEYEDEYEEDSYREYDDYDYDYRRYRKRQAPVRSERPTGTRSERPTGTGRPTGTRTERPTGTVTRSERPTGTGSSRPTQTSAPQSELERTLQPAIENVQVFPGSGLIALLSSRSSNCSLTPLVGAYYTAFIKPSVGKPGVYELFKPCSYIDAADADALVQAVVQQSGPVGPTCSARTSSVAAASISEGQQNKVSAVGSSASTAKLGLGVLAACLLLL